MFRDIPTTELDIVLFLAYFKANSEAAFQRIHHWYKQDPQHPTLLRILYKIADLH